MLEVNNLSKRISQRQILENIAFSVAPGELVTVLGPNGAGKSTLLGILSFVMGPSDGKYFINSIDAFRKPEKAKNLLGVLSHQSFLYEHLTVFENLNFYGKMYNLQQIRNRIEEVIINLDLELFLHEPVKNLSRGLKQRAAIARTILHNPSFLLLDEPQTGLDQQSTRNLYKTLAILKQNGTGVLVITHLFDDLVLKSNKTLIINKGKQVNYGPIPLDLENVKNIYNRCCV